MAEVPSSAFFTTDHVATATPGAGDNSAASLIPDVVLLPGSDEFAAFFEVDRVVEWVKEHAYERVAFQLPDSLLSYAFELAFAVEKQCDGCKVYILADTTYRSCCVDVVAAQHANCDALVHFGEACLSAPTTTLPVLYVFGSMPLDVSDLNAQLTDFSVDGKSVRAVVVLFEPSYTSSQEELEGVIRRHFASSAVTVCPIIDRDSSDSDSACRESLGRKLPTEWNEENHPDCLVFVGRSDSALLPVWLLTHPGFEKVVVYDPVLKKLSSDTPKTNRALRKRLFLIEKVRDADVIGLVVGTVGIDNVKLAIARVRQLCKAAKKKVYVLAVGKVNEAKLSNFANDIDVFVLLSCPFGVILDAMAFYKPVVSLFEAEIALNPSKDWCATVGWTAQFDQFVHDEVGVEDADAADVSLLTGRIRAAKFEDEVSGGGSGGNQVIEYRVNDLLANRSWRGLDNARCDEDVDVHEGLAGVAAVYSTEPAKK